jgi:LuxR family maltose regulon positive regulatory protein
MIGGGLTRGPEAVPHKCVAAHEPTRFAFSDKERAALRLAASGVSNEEIARRLGVTIHTIKWHLANVYTKLGVRNRTAAVKVALAMDLV